MSDRSVISMGLFGGEFSPDYAGGTCTDADQESTDRLLLPQQGLRLSVQVAK